MKIGTLRTRLQKLTGRVDLTSEELTDYLNSGQRLLDERTEFKHAEAQFLGQLTIGDYFQHFIAKPKVIDQVLLLDTDRTILELSYLPLKELKLLNVKLIGSTDVAAPTYYSLGEVRRIPDSVNNAGYADVGVISTGDSSDYNSIIFNSPVDKAYLLNVSGKFFSPFFTDETVTLPNIVVEETWWSRNHYDLLIQAARYKIDVDLNNREGATERLSAIEYELREIIFDSIEQEVAHNTVMRG